MSRKCRRYGSAAARVVPRSSRTPPWERSVHVPPVGGGGGAAVEVARDGSQDKRQPPDLAVCAVALTVTPVSSSGLPAPRTAPVTSTLGWEPGLLAPASPATRWARWADAPRAQRPTGSCCRVVAGRHTTKPPLRRPWRQGLRGGPRPVRVGEPAVVSRRSGAPADLGAGYGSPVGAHGRVGLRWSWLDDVDEGLGDDGVAGSVWVDVALAAEPVPAHTSSGEKHSPRWS